MQQLTHLSLFSGIGGLDLAAEMAGVRSVGQCEWADYPTKILEKHWPNVPRWRDIRTLTGDDFYARTGLRTVDVISGGFPCQPFSVAGKQRGKEDDRYLWPEMCRVISEIQPAWVIGENVPGIINLALDTVLSDLESQGYTCQTFIIPAAGVDAPHRRERICIVANRNNRQCVTTDKEVQTRRDTARAGCQERPSYLLENTACGGWSEPENECEQSRGTNIKRIGEIFSDADRDGSDTRRPESERQQREAGVADGSDDVSHTNTIRCDVRGLSRERVQRTEPPRDETDSGGKDVADPMRIGSTSGAADTPAGEEREPAKPFDGGTISPHTDSQRLSFSG